MQGGRGRVQVVVRPVFEFIFFSRSTSAYFPSCFHCPAHGFNIRASRAAAVKFPSSFRHAPYLLFIYFWIPHLRLHRHRHLCVWFSSKHARNCGCCVTRNVGPQPSAFGLGRATGIQMKKRKDCFSDPIIYITHKPASSPESEEKSAPQYCSTT